MKPRVKITDAKFAYTSACDTDIRRLFKRIRKAQALQTKREQEPKQSAETTVLISNFAARRAKERT